MSIQDDLDQLSQIVAYNKIGELSREDLEKYANALCFSFASDKFGKHQFPQVCETIRLLLIKKYTESVNEQNAEMQISNLNLQKQNIRLQRFVVTLMVVTILTAVIQIFVTLRPNSQLQQQTELLKAIALQQKASQTVQTTAPIPCDNHQKKTSKKETKQ
jgi:hypothetical protein